MSICYAVVGCHPCARAEIGWWIHFQGFLVGHRSAWCPRSPRPALPAGQSKGLSVDSLPYTFNKPERDNKMVFWEAGFWIPNKWIEKQQQSSVLKCMTKWRREFQSIRSSSVFYLVPFLKSFEYKENIVQFFKCSWHKKVNSLATAQPEFFSL